MFLYTILIELHKLYDLKYPPGFCIYIICNKKNRLSKGIDLLKIALKIV